MAQGEVGKFGELLSFSHVTARIINPNAKKANANLTNANFSVISLSYLGIDLVCEVPVVVLVVLPWRRRSKIHQYPSPSGNRRPRREGELYVHRGFEGVARELAVPLGGVTVAHEQQGAWFEDGRINGDASRIRL